MTYECSICHGVNHLKHFHCGYCGTIPARYSWKQEPLKMDDDGSDIGRAGITVLVALGAERATITRTVKRAIRTVPLDYYAEV